MKLISKHIKIISIVVLCILLSLSIIRIISLQSRVRSLENNMIVISNYPLNIRRYQRRLIKVKEEGINERLEIDNFMERADDFNKSMRRISLVNISYSEDSEQAYIILRKVTKMTMLVEDISSIGIEQGFDYTKWEKDDKDKFDNVLATIYKMREFFDKTDSAAFDAREFTSLFLQYVFAGDPIM